MPEVESVPVDLTGAVWAGENWKEDLDRLKELQGKGNFGLLDSDKQEKFILQTHLHPMSCPLCETKVGAKENDVNCPVCGVGLRRVVPFVKVCDPGWHWIINEESRKELLRLWREK